MNVVLISKSYDDLLQLVANLRELKEREGEGEGKKRDVTIYGAMSLIRTPLRVKCSPSDFLKWVQRLYKLLCEREEKREQA